MPRQPSPWFRAGRGWYVQVRGQKVFLGRDKAKAFEQFHQLMATLPQQRPAAIFINPVNWEGIRGSLAEARRKEVPVIVVDAPVSDPEMVLCQVASDNVEAGRLAAE